MEQEKRMVGDYEIRNAIHIGDRELLLGVNMNDSNRKYYMTCYAKSNFVVEYYEEALASDDFLEIAQIFADRLKEQVEKTISPTSSVIAPKDSPQKTAPFSRIKYAFIKSCLSILVS